VSPAAEEELLDYSPACAPPRLDYESHATSLDRTKWVRSRSPPGFDEPRACPDLPAGPQRAAVSGSIGADIEALGAERGRRILAIVRKGGKWVTIPLALRIARAIEFAIEERSEGPIFLTAGRRGGTVLPR
jgi:integrase/recombinase XerD